MPILRETDLEVLLACPQCLSALDRSEQGYRCSCGFFGPRVGRWPVLVDFNSSILNREELMGRAGGSAVPRARARLLKRVGEVVSRLRPPTPTAQIDRVIHLLPPSALVLVVGGSAAQPGLAPLYAQPSVSIIGFDIYGSDLVQFIADGHSIPLMSGSVDAVVIQAVLEHVLDPPRVVQEIHRVLRPDGIVYAETAFMQQVHEGAYDFTRYTESGHRWLFRNFELVEAGSLTGPATQFIWTADYLFRALVRSQTAGRVLHRLLSPLSIADRLFPTSYSVDTAPAVFFLGRRSESSLTPHEMVAYYKGAQ